MASGRQCGEGRERREERVFTDDGAIDVASVGAGDVRVTGPGGFEAIAELVEIDMPVDGSPRTGRYRISPPGGGWDFADNGVYTITLEPDQVMDTAGLAAAGAESLGAGAPWLTYLSPAMASVPDDLRRFLTNNGGIALQAPREADQLDPGVRRGDERDGPPSGQPAVPKQPDAGSEKSAPPQPPDLPPSGGDMPVPSHRHATHPDPPPPPANPARPGDVVGALDQVFEEDWGAL